jgi:hypothetical protein
MNGLGRLFKGSGLGGEKQRIVEANRGNDPIDMV